MAADRNVQEGVPSADRFIKHMTYGDFAWANLQQPRRRRDERRGRPRASFVQGDPVPWMEPGDEAWAWKVRRSLPHPFDHPYLTFVLPPKPHRGPWALDDFLQPIMLEVRNTPVSMWAKMTYADRTGLRIADTVPAFPPKLERVFTVETPAGHCEPDDVAVAIESQSIISGQTDIGVHITVKRLSRDDYDFGGNVRTIFDGLSTLLGGDVTRPADRRIRDLRMVRDSHHGDITEVRVWQIPEERR